jgi:hypothetical protein
LYLWCLLFLGIVVFLDFGMLLGFGFCCLFFEIFSLFFVFVYAGVSVLCLYVSLPKVRTFGLCEKL